MAVKLDAARAQVLLAAVASGVAVLPFFQLAAYVAQQAGQQAFVQGLVAGGAGVFAPLVLGGHGAQLGVDVAPLAHAAHADVVLPQQGFPLAVAEAVGGRFSRVCGLVFISQKGLCRTVFGALLLLFL